MHTVYLPDDDLFEPLIRVTGEEAKHAARVKRLDVGERVLVMNGRGVVVLSAVEEARRELALRAIERRDEPRPTPRIEVWSATPKGDRLGTMIEGLVQAGAAEWVALDTKLGVVDPGEGKIERVKRIALEASKQAQRAWLMDVGRRGNMRDALSSPPLPQGENRGENRGEGPPSAPSTTSGPKPKAPSLLLLDSRGEPLAAATDQLRRAALVHLLIGPEGGWTESELNDARRAGATIAAIGPHVMRIETAAVVGCAMVGALARN